MAGNQGSPYQTPYNNAVTATLAQPNFTFISRTLATLAYVGVGIYDLTLDQGGYAQGRYGIIIVPTAATSPAWKIVDTSNTAKRLTFVDNAGAAIELSYIGVFVFRCEQ